MKLVTLQTTDGTVRAGVADGQQIIGLEYASLLELLRDPAGLDHARAALEQGQSTGPYVYVYNDQQGGEAVLDSLQPVYGEVAEEYPSKAVTLLPPLPEPPTFRDFYAFEQHVRAANALRKQEIPPEWYEIPIFYFTNTSELYGYDSAVPYPEGSQALDFELEIACVIGKEGKNIPAEEAADYIAGYTIMNDWSARDLQLKEMRLNLGPSKGKDFATSLGPWLVTSDELAARRSGSGASERYDMTMLARVNGREVSRGNFKDIHYSFPQLVAWASRNARLRVGDVIGSGTVGTGCILELGTSVQPWLKRGDTVELEIEGIGILRNTIE